MDIEGKLRGNKPCIKSRKTLKCPIENGLGNVMRDGDVRVIRVIEFTFEHVTANPGFKALASGNPLRHRDEHDRRHWPKRSCSTQLDDEFLSIGSSLS